MFTLAHERILNSVMYPSHGSSSCYCQICLSHMKSFITAICRTETFVCSLNNEHLDYYLFDISRKLHLKKQRHGTFSDDEYTFHPEQMKSCSFAVDAAIWSRPANLPQTQHIRAHRLLTTHRYNTTELKTSSPSRNKQLANAHVNNKLVHSKKWVKN